VQLAGYVREMDGRKQRDAVELRCSTASCGSDTEKQTGKKQKQEKPKTYLHYSFNTLNPESSMLTALVQHGVGVAVEVLKGVGVTLEVRLVHLYLYP